MMSFKTGGLVAAVVLFGVLLAGEASNPVLSDIVADFETAGIVTAIVQQPDGKVVIGGLFTSVNGINRNNIARLNVDGSLDEDWNPDANKMVNALVISGANYYVGGGF